MRAHEDVRAAKRDDAKGPPGVFAFASDCDLSAAVAQVLSRTTTVSTKARADAGEAAKSAPSLTRRICGNTRTSPGASSGCALAPVSLRLSFTLPRADAPGANWCTALLYAPAAERSASFTANAPSPSLSNSLDGHAEASPSTRKRWASCAFTVPTRDSEYISSRPYPTRAFVRGL